MTRYAPPPAGRFSAFGYAYRIEPHAVTLQRNPWLAVPGVVLLVGGVGLMAMVNEPFGFVLGFVGALSIAAGGLLALSGLGSPRRVTATAEGIRWGRWWLAADKILSIEAATKDIRVKGTQVWFSALVLTRTGAPDLELRLQDGQQRNLRVEAIAHAMATTCKLRVTK